MSNLVEYKPGAAFPGADWERISPAEAGFSPEKLQAAQRWLDGQGKPEQGNLELLKLVLNALE